MLFRSPAALAFVQAPKPSPVSFAREAYFGVTAFRFINREDIASYGRYRITPVAGVQHLDDAAAKGKDPDYLFGELRERVARQGVEFNIVGNTSSSQAAFNENTVLGVTVNIRDGSNLPPLCLIDSDPRVGYVGTTGETNNLTLGPCHSTIANGYPAIQFLEGSGQAFEQSLIGQTGTVGLTLASAATLR